MSETTEPGSLGPLFQHALRLHRQYPDEPLPRNGEPYPDEEIERRRQYSSGNVDQRLRGADVAAILDHHFGNPSEEPSALVDAFRDVDVPINRNEHIVAAALRGHRIRVRQTGRWLVEHGTDRNCVAVGLALLATDSTTEDISVIQTIGLLSDHFGPLAAEALRRRRGGGRALMWLAQRVDGWGRVYIVEALCEVSSGDSRQWLLRHACDGDHLNGYFAGRVATAAHLHEAIVGSHLDDELVDHTGRLMSTMTYCGGMGMTLANYPPTPLVLAAHVAHLGHQAPTVDRYVTTATIADHLANTAPARSSCSPEQRDRLARDYFTVLEQAAWCTVVRADLGRNTDFYDWFARTVATRLRLTAFTDYGGGEGLEKSH